MSIFFRDSIFFFIVVSLLFTEIPNFMRMKFFGGPFANELVCYPLYACIIFSFYLLLSRNIKSSNIKIVILYSVVYLFSSSLSLFLGTYELLCDESINIIGNINGEKVQTVLLYLSDFFQIDSQQKLLIIGLALRNLKSLILEVVLCIGSSYFVYIWYKDSIERLNSVIKIALYTSIIIISSYSIVEIFYQLGSIDAQYILEYVTPFIHRVKGANDYWWPPLLWPNQLRSVFAEPSFFACYLACILPFFWSKICQGEKYILNLFIIWLLNFYLFLTQTRTGTAILFMEFFGFIILSFYIYKKSILKSCLSIFIVMILSFFSSIYLPSIYGTLSQEHIYTNNDIYSQTTEYFQSNIQSLANDSSRSNKARLTMNYASIKIGMRNPLFGVGKGLRSIYVENNIPEWGKKDQEVSMWIDNYQKQGIMQYNYPLLGEYTSRFAETGVFGLLLFLLPSFVLYYKYLKLIKLHEYDYNFLFLNTSLFGIMLFGFVGSMVNEYIYWILLAYGYAYVEQREIA